MKRIFLISAIALLAGCNNSGTNQESKRDTSGSTTSTMSSNENPAERNMHTALEAVQAVNAHDVDAMLKNVTPDATDYGDGTGPVVKGSDSVRYYIKSWLNAFPDVKGENLEAFGNSDGSKVIVVGEWTGTFKNDLMGMKATGKSFKYWDGDLFTFNNDGKMTSHRAIQTWMTTMAQVGAKMPK